MSEKNKRTKIGFNYFQDYDHYRQEDVQKWLPKLKDMNVGWLVLNAPDTISISENFIKPFLESGIEIILHFKFSPKELPNLNDFDLLIKNYARWGVRYVCVFDKPNMRNQWEKSEWQQTNIVQRFADLFSLVSQPILAAGMMPILPPLEPGGDFWDTAFLETLLREFKKNYSPALLQSIGVGANAWFDEKPISWGAGGQDIFPATKPYFTPKNSEDQKGFRIFEWYNTVIYSVVEKGMPIFLMAVGEEHALISEERHMETLEGILETIDGKQTDMLKRMPENVVSCNFWHLAASPKNGFAIQAWFSENGENLRDVELLETMSIQDSGLVEDYVLEKNFQKEGFHEVVEGNPEAATFVEKSKNVELDAEDETQEGMSFGHVVEEKRVDNRAEQNIGKPTIMEKYVLLPSYEWGVSDWHLDVIKPYVKKYKPTIGFSVKEARAAKTVLVVGADSDFPKQDLSELYRAGCVVKQMRGDADKIEAALAKA